MAKYLSSVPIPLGSRLRSMRPLPAKGRSGNGAPLLEGGFAPGSVVTRRDAHHHQLHRAPVAHAARRLLRGLASAERLGSRSGPPTTEVLSPTPRPPRRNPNWEIVRRRHADPRGT